MLSDHGAALAQRSVKKRLKLVVNQEKSQVARSDRVKLLELTIVKATIAISHKALQYGLPIMVATGALTGLAAPFMIRAFGVLPLAAFADLFTLP